MRSVLSIPLALLANAPVHAKFQERVRALCGVYQQGGALPPIPVRMDLHGNLRLDRDGNHRLAAARQLGLEAVEVSIDARDADRLRDAARRLG